jgi:hypothetical protein
MELAFLQPEFSRHGKGRWRGSLNESLSYTTDKATLRKRRERDKNKKRMLGWRDKY